MRRGKENGIGVGTASILMIVMVLAFTTFGILSLVSAQADWEMSRKAAELSGSWYAAEARMQERLADIDSRLAAGEEVFAESGLLELTEPVRDGQELQAALRPGTDGGYEIVRYGLVNTGEWTPDNGLNIWDGGE